MMPHYAKVMTPYALVSKSHASAINHNVGITVFMLKHTFVLCIDPYSMTSCERHILHSINNYYYLIIV